jgi:hypothetical protein
LFISYVLKVSAPHSFKLSPKVCSRITVAERWCINLPNVLHFPNHLRLGMIKKKLYLYIIIYSFYETSPNITCNHYRTLEGASRWAYRCFCFHQYHIHCTFTASADTSHRETVLCAKDQTAVDACALYSQIFMFQKYNIMSLFSVIYEIRFNFV